MRRRSDKSSEQVFAVGGKPLPPQDRDLLEYLHVLPGTRRVVATEKQRQAARRNLEKARAARNSGRTRPKQPSGRLSDRDRAAALAAWSRIKRGDKYDVEIEPGSWREVRRGGKTARR